MKKDVIEKLTTLITAAFGLVAALAWNDAIKALFVGPCGTENAGAFCSISSTGPWVYAIIVTIIAVFVTIRVGRIAANATKKSELKEKNIKKVKKSTTKKRK